jgi:malate synthase
MMATRLHERGGATLLDEGIEIRGTRDGGFAEILSPEAVSFVALLAREFRDERDRLLRRRNELQAHFDAGALPDFLPETRGVRESEWRIAPVPRDLQDRRVEITGPVDRKMIVNALNSGASVFMADFEDSHSPTWSGCIQGQINVHDAVRRTIEHRSPEGKLYRLNPQVATLVVRPRGWHLHEKHMVVDGRPVPASLFDFGLFLFHNAETLVRMGSGPYFYLPKMESHLEARLWNDVFVRAQELLGLDRGVIRATVLIETILAAFEMDEILFELREHITGLNCGRWDYIFSFIKKFRNRPEFVLPDRAQVTMAAHFLHSYSLLAIRTCHRRGAHAIGGMAAQIPIKNDPAANELALEKVRADKLREAGDGHDGTWVAHPALVPIAKEIFDRHMPGPHQVDKTRDDVQVDATDLLRLPEGSITESGIRTNLSVGVQYMEAWLNGLGCVPLYNLMEDAATAEISRTQLWQWIHNPGATLQDGREIDLQLVRGMFAEEMEKIRTQVGQSRFASGKYGLAARLFDDIVSASRLEDFLTVRAYDFLD